MNIQSIELKVANMRKPQRFVIYPNGTSDKYIILQSDKRMAALNKHSNDFYITSKSYNYPTFAHLQMDRVKAELTSARIEEIRRKYSAMSNGSNGMIRIL